MRCFGAVIGEVLGFKLGVVLHIDVVAMKTPANGFAGVDLRASAFAVGHGNILLLAKRLGLGLRPASHRLRHAALLLGFVLRARSEFDWALAVGIAVHGEAADANAVLPAFVVMPVYLAPVPVREPGIAVISHHSAPTESGSPHGRLAGVSADCFAMRHTLAREMPCFLATCVSDMPERRSNMTCSRSTSSRARPIWRPSSLALRMPARTRSMMMHRSSSAIAETMTIMALPRGPSVSIASRWDRN